MSTALISRVFDNKCMYNVRGFIDIMSKSGLLRKTKLWIDRNIKAEEIRVHRDQEGFLKFLNSQLIRGLFIGE